MNSIDVRKEVGLMNPIITQRFMADPYAIEYNGRVYVYGSNDSDSMIPNGDGTYPKNSYRNIKSINCISSADLVNWTDHGEIQVASDENKGKEGIAKWAGNSWAPAICYNKVKDAETGEMKTKFFLYFANSASSIGVLCADSPTGPWVDPIGKPMITRDMPGCETVEWLFDPAVLVDDDGVGYIYFGGGVPEGKAVAPQTARVAKLGADMVSLDGEAILIDAPYIFEDSGINKINGKYYYSYCINWSEEAGENMGKAQIAYMVSDNPMGPFEYKGVVMKNPGQSEFFSPTAWGNNHHCMLTMNDKIYMFYHTPQYEIDLDMEFTKEGTEGCAYRTTYIDMVTLNEDGSLWVENMTKKGTLEPLCTFDPFADFEPVTFVWANGITAVEKSGKEALSFNENDAWIGISKADFSAKTAKKLSVDIVDCTGAEILVYVDDMSEENCVAKALCATTGTFDIDLNKEISGVHDIFIKADTDNVEGLILSNWKFA